MRKNVFGRRFKRDTNERKALFKGLMSSLILYEQIKTTEQKAKAIKGQVEKLVTKANRKGKAASFMFSAYLSPAASAKLFADVAPRFINRPGGYTRIIPLGQRSDSAKMVVMEWVEKKSITSSKSTTGTTGRRKKEEKEATEVIEAEIVSKPANKISAKKAVKKETKKEKKPVKKAVTK